MTNEEKDKLMKELLKVRQEIDINYSHPFTFFVEAVHNLSQRMIPVIKQQEALAYKLLEIEAKLRDAVTTD